MRNTLLAVPSGADAPAPPTRASVMPFLLRKSNLVHHSAASASSGSLSRPSRGHQAQIRLSRNPDTPTPPVRFRLGHAVSRMAVAFDRSRMAVKMTTQRRPAIAPPDHEPPATRWYRPCRRLRSCGRPRLTHASARVSVGISGGWTRTAGSDWLLTWFAIEGHARADGRAFAIDVSNGLVVHRLGRPREAEPLGDRDEVAQSAERHARRTTPAIGLRVAHAGPTPMRAGGAPARARAPRARRTRRGTTRLSRVVASR